jgi:hypothetical protein
MNTAATSSDRRQADDLHPVIVCPGALAAIEAGQVAGRQKHE